MAFVLKDDCALALASAAGKKLFEAKLQFFSPTNPPIEEEKKHKLIESTRVYH